MDEIYYKARFLSEFLYNELIIKNKEEKVLEELLRGDDILLLQDFIGKYLKNEHTWMTQIGLIEASKLIVKDALANGNIPAKVSA